jgi:hypothetical protein
MPAESKSRGQGRVKLSALVDSGSAPGFQPVTFAGTSIYVHKLALNPKQKNTLAIARFPPSITRDPDFAALSRHSPVNNFCV